MATMLNVYDRATRKKTAVLQNAFDIVETQEMNQIYLLSFTMPAEDEKNGYCLPRHYIRYGDNGELYRIKAPKVSENDTSTVTYECEHVITTLCDDIMFGSYIFGGSGITTADVIDKEGYGLLRLQKTRNWRLGECDFSRQFEYNWEQENLLNALYSIPREFINPYMWVFDTQTYPWTISLKQISRNTTPTYYLRAKSNILSSGSSADYANICTRIYPLGYGEGVNQLTIRDATVINVVKDPNDENLNISGEPSIGATAEKYGNTYIQSDQSYVEKYGIVEKVLVDRRFEHANTLFGYAKRMLEVYQEPTFTRTFDVTDLYPITNKPLDDAQVGKVCKLVQDGTKAFITKTVRRWDVAGDLQIGLSTKANDIASNVADLADRIRIESVYAQGATQLYQHSKDANAAPTINKNGERVRGKGMVISLYFPSEMKQINKVLLKLELKKFRSYSQATETADVTVDSCENVTVTVNTNTKALSGQYTSYSGGGTTSASGASGFSSALAADGDNGYPVSVGEGDYTGLGTNPSTNAKGVGSISVSASGTVSAPMYSQTSEPSTDVTSAEIWNYSQFSNLQTGTVVANQNNVYTADADGSEGEHNHQITSVNIPVLTIDKQQLEHKHNISHYHKVTVSGSGSGGSHSHSFPLPRHTHTISSHKHDLPDLSHKHSITLNGHTHKVTLKGHDHKITPGIFENNETPTQFDVWVGSKNQATVIGTSFEGDITEWLLNNKRQIPRDSWIKVEIVPDTLAYVVSSVFVQGFVQSRGGGNY